MACAGAAGLPLAARNETLTVVPAPLPDDALQRRLAGGAAFAIIKGGPHLSRVRRGLGDNGPLARSWDVERASLATQRPFPLRELQAESAPYFSMVLVTAASEP